MFFSLGAIILYFLYRSQAAAYAEQCVIDGIPAEECNLLNKLFTDFKSTNKLWLLVVVLCYMASNLSRARRWMMMFKPLGYKIHFFNALGTVMLGYFANLGVPRLGEILRPVALSRYEKVEVEKVFGTIVAERALDVVMLAIFLALTFMLEYDIVWNFIKENQALSDKIVPILTSPIFYIAIVIMGAAAVYFFFSKRFKESKLGAKLHGLFNGLLEGLKSIFKLDRPFIFILHTVFIWIMYFMMTRLCFYAFEPTAHLTVLAGLMIFVLGAIGIVFPSPGGMGTYHALVMGGLALYGIDQIEGFSFANIVFFTIQIFCNLFFGLLAYLLLPIFNRKYEGAVPIQN